MAQTFIEDKTDAITFEEKQPGTKRGILLSDADEFVLKRIFEHKILSSQDIHKLYQLHDANRSKQSITNRIIRLVNSHLLVRRESYSSRKKWYTQYYYTLTKRGYYLLEKINYLPQGFSEKKIDVVRVPSEHNEFAIEQMIGLTALFFSQLDAENIMRSTMYPVFNPMIQATPVIPDYVVKCNEHLFCIEFDTGTEQLSKLTSKTERYVKLYREERFGGIQPIVLFVVKSAEGVTPQLKRIQNIKAAHLPLMHELGDVPVYVVSDLDFLTLMELFVTKQYPIQPHVESMVNMDMAMFYQQKHRLLRGWDSERVPLERVVSSEELAAQRKLPTCTLLKYFTYRGVLKTQIYVTHEMGNARHYLLTARLLTELGNTKDTLFAQEYVPFELVLTYPYISNALLSAQRLGITTTIPTVLQTEQEIIDATNRINAMNEDSNWEENYVIQYFEMASAYSLIAKKG